MQDKLLQEAVENISKNHRKIIDDWCKAYMAQLYEENGSIKPGDFILVEQVPTIHDYKDCLVKKYWFEPNTKLKIDFDLCDECKNKDSISLEESKNMDEWCKMSYFLIYRLESGIRIKQFSTDDDLKKNLESNFTDSPVNFLNYVPRDLDELGHGDAVVIKGEVIKPRPVQIVKTFEID